MTGLVRRRRSPPALAGARPGPAEVKRITLVVAGARVLVDLRGQGEPVEPGHQRVGEHQVEGLAAAEPPRSTSSAAAAARDRRRISQLASTSDRIRRFVALSSTTARAGRAGSGRAHRRRASGARRPKRATKWKRLPLPELAVDPDASAHQLDQLRGDRQAEAGAAVAARGRRVGLHERPRRSSPCLSGAMPMPVSRTQNCSVAASLAAVVRRDARRTTSPRVGELDGVADEVEDHLPQAAGVADERRRHVRRDAAGQLEALLVRARREQSDPSSTRVAERERRALERRAGRPRSSRRRGCR